MKQLKSFLEFIGESESLIMASPMDGLDMARQLKLYLGKEEEAENSGEMVKSMLASVGLGPGHPWCMAFVYFIFDNFCTKNGLKNPLPKTAAVMTFWNSAPKSNKISAADAKKNPALVKPGQIFVKSRSGGGHTGIVIRVLGDKFISVDGNSSDSVKLNTYAIGDMIGFVDYFVNDQFSATLASQVDSMISMLPPTQGGGKET